MSPQKTRTSTIATWSIIFCTVIWGSTYFLTKLSIEEIPVFFFQEVRHLVALLTFLPLFGRFRKVNRSMLIAAFYSATASFFMLAFQTYGLMWTEFVPNTKRLGYQTFPRLSAYAETAWTNPQLKNFPSFYSRIDKLFTRLDYLGIPHASKKQSNPICINCWFLK
jgi:hypothetical protein